MGIESDALAAIRPELDRISAKDLRRPPGPVQDIVLDCSRIKACAMSDVAHYGKIRYNVTAAAALLGLAASGLSEAERLWRVEVGLNGIAEETWLANRDKAYELRAEAEDYIAHVLLTGGTPDHIRRLKEIRKGRGHSDMIDDLGALAALAGDLAAELEAIGYDAAKIAALMDHHVLLTDVYGTVLADRAGDSPAQLLRNRAYVYAHRLREDIKAAARLALRNEPELLARYTSPYSKGGGETTPATASGS